MSEIEQIKSELRDMVSIRSVDDWKTHCRYLIKLAEDRGRALEAMADSDDDWYVGRTPMKEFARQALGRSE